MPVWDKVFYKVKNSIQSGTALQRTSNLENNNNPGLLIIPFQAQNSSKIQSYIVAYKHNDSNYTYRLYNRDVLNSIHPTSESKKKDLRNSQTVIAYFEKSINNVDSIIIPNTQSTYTVLKNVSLSFTVNNNATSSLNNSQSVWTCIYTVWIVTSAEIIIYQTNQMPMIYWSITYWIAIDVDCWEDGTPSPGTGSSGSPSNPNSGTGGNGNGSTWPNNNGNTNSGNTGGSSSGGTSGSSGSPNTNGGSTGGSSGGGPFYPWWDGNDQTIGVGYSPIVISLTNSLGLSTEQSNWLQNNSYHAAGIQNYLQISSNSQSNIIAYTHIVRLMNSDLGDVNSYAQFLFNVDNTNYSNNMWWENSNFLAQFGGLNFGNWAINYLASHPEVSFEIFRKQFMSIREGEDGIYDPTYWDNPNLSFPPQTLPNWVSFNSVFPKHDDPLLTTPEQMYNLVGGNVLALYNTDPPKYQNTCALRISRALNYAIPNTTTPPTPAIVIPNIPGQTFKGSDNKYYFLSAAALKKWMIKTFGMPTGTNRLTGSQGGPHGDGFVSLLNGKKGIYIMTPNYPGNAYFGASGHADMIENGICDGDCYFDGSEWGGIEEILIWELP